MLKTITFLAFKLADVVFIYHVNLVSLVKQAKCLCVNHNYFLTHQFKHGLDAPKNHLIETVHFNSITIECLS